MAATDKGDQSVSTSTPPALVGSSDSPSLEGLPGPGGRLDHPFRPTASSDIVPLVAEQIAKLAVSHRRGDTPRPTQLRVRTQSVSRALDSPYSLPVRVIESSKAVFEQHEQRGPIRSPRRSKVSISAHDAP